MKNPHYYILCKETIKNKRLYINDYQKKFNRDCDKNNV